MLKVESSKPLHCVEMVTGRNLTGNILLSEESICAHIYSYTESFYIDGEKPIFLQAETNEIVSLHSNFTTGPGTIWRGIEPLRTTYRQEIISNLAVVGFDPWTAEDKVKRVTFSVKHTKELMRHKEKFGAVGRERFPREGELTIFTDVAEGITVKSWYAATYGMDFDAPKELWPVFEIEFDEPRSIMNYIVSVSDFVGFLSFCLGVQLKPSAIRIDRFSFGEMTAAITSQSYPGNHEVHYVWPESQVDTQSLWIGGSPVRAWDDEELKALRECIVAWMNRAGQWRKPYRLMMESLGLKNVVSAERLINACRWFEDIPLSKTQNALSDEEIESISAAAAKKADEFGISPVIRERIASAIRRVKSESAEQRFTRLVAMVEGKFGKGILDENAIAHLRRAIQFRGRTAHGHFNPESDAEFRAFSKSTRAMEALCYLLTAVDLPISDAGKQRTGANPIVQDYRMCYE